MQNQNQETAHPLMRWFAKFHHQPKHVHWISHRVFILASDMDGGLPESAEKSAGMRKLLEAKDCFVRAAIEAGESEVL